MEKTGGLEGHLYVDFVESLECVEEEKGESLECKELSFCFIIFAFWVPHNTSDSLAALIYCTFIRRQKINSFYRRLFFFWQRIVNFYYFFVLFPKVGKCSFVYFLPTRTTKL